MSDWLGVSEKQTSILLIGEYLPFSPRGLIKKTRQL